jgi:hypothetical protein
MSGKDMFRGSSIIASFEGPRCFTTDCFEDEMDIIELGAGPAIAMINENDFDEAFTLEVLEVRFNRANRDWYV